MTVSIAVGPSTSNTKTVSLPIVPDRGPGAPTSPLWNGVLWREDYSYYIRNLKCPNVVSKKNWGGDARYGDTFSATPNGMSLTIRRTDSNGGWGMNLVVKCSVSAPDFRKDWRKRVANPPFGCVHKVATVSCPCTSSNGQPMTEEEAQNNIITQVAEAGLRVNMKRGHAALDRKNWGVPYPTFLITLKSTIAVAKMTQCWRKKCAGGCNSKGGSGRKSQSGTHGSGEDASMLDLSLGTDLQWGGGASC